MSSDEPGRWLRERLDAELDDVSPDPRVLSTVLSSPSPSRRRTPALRPPRLLVVAAAALAVLAVLVAVPLLTPGRTGSSDQLAGPPDAPPATSPDPLPSPTAPVEVPATALPTAPPPVLPPAATPTAAVPPAAAACGPRGAAPAGGARLDVDGDGADDVLIAGDGRLRLWLSSARATVTAPLSTASPYVSVLAVPADATPGAEVLVGTRGAIGRDGQVGTVARLYDLRGCTFAPVDGVTGRPYDFEVGLASATQRSGVLCDGGVLYGRTAVLRDGAWQVTDTPVSSRTGTAVNGTPRRSTVADTSPQAQDLARESCGGDPQPLG